MKYFGIIVISIFRDYHNSILVRTLNFQSRRNSNSIKYQLDPALLNTASNAIERDLPKCSTEKYMPVSNKTVVIICIGMSGIVLGLLGLLAYSMIQIPTVRHSLGKMILFY